MTICLKPKPFIAAALLAAAALAAGPAFAERAAIELPKARIASLNESVQTAFVAPDGKIWLQMKPQNNNGRQIDLDAVQDNIEKEWDQPMPQIQGARVALFEPAADGKSVARVWFAFQGPISAAEGRYGNMLIGFDGKKWVERSAADTNNGGFSGSPLLGGNPNNSQGNNLYVAGNAFFVVPNGVYFYDGKNWSSRDFGSERGYGYAPRLIPDADGKGLLAISYTGNAHALYRWRAADNKWTKIMGSNNDNERVNIQSVVPAEKGVYVMHTLVNYGYNTITYLPYDPTPSIPVDKLIEQLKDKDFKAREDATAALIARGDAASAKITEAIKANENDDVKYRLEYIKANLNKVAAARTPSYSGYPTFTLGSFNLQQPAYLTPLPDGRALVAAQIISKEDPNRSGIATVLVMDKTGAWAKLSGGDDAPLRTNYNSNSGMPIAIDGGKKVWLPGDGYNTPAILFDLDKQSVIAKTPILSNTQILGATTDGKLLLQTPTGVAVFDKDAPDNRVPLAVKETLNSGYIMAISDDGTIWTQNAQQSGFTYWDGKAWQTNEKLANLRLQNNTMAPGRNGSMLCSTDRGWTLLTKDKVYDSDSLDDLIQSNQKVFTEAFGGPRLAPRNQNYNEGVIIQADKAGNIWVLRQQTHNIKVLIKDKWIDAMDALKSAGAKNPKIGFLAGVGDMSKVFVTDVESYNQTAISALGEVDDKGELSFKALPRSDMAQRAGRPVYDKSGALWASALEQNPNRGQIMQAVRITEKGAGEKVEAGFPVLVDSADNVWMRPNYYYSDGSQNRLSIWRDGKTTKLPAIPGANIQDTRMMFSDKPGSVYIYTDLGLQQLTADKPDDPASYKLGTLYSLDSADGRPQQIEYTGHGFVAIMTNKRTGGYTLSLIELPK